MTVSSTTSDELTAEKRAQVSKSATNLLNGFRSPVKSLLENSKLTNEEIKSKVLDHIKGQLAGTFKGANLHKFYLELNTSVSTFVDDLSRESTTAVSRRSQDK
jgi:hypothetical protein